jgi:PST family polysaccharide transporter
LTDKKQITSGLSWNTLTVVLQVVIQIAYTGLLARLVSKDSFMLMGIVLGIMGFAEIFSQVGVGPALIQRKEVHQQHINGAFYTAIILGLTFTLIFIGSAPLIASWYQLPELKPIIAVVCSSFTISALAVVPRSMMMKNMRFKTMFKASMISIIGGNLIVGLTLAFLGWNVWAYVWALFAQNLLMTIALWCYEPVKLTVKWQWSYTRELIRYGAGSTLFNALNYLATKLDVLLIPRMMRGQMPEMLPEQKASASYYERANYAMTQPITVMGKLSDSVLFSGMSKLQDEHVKLKKILKLATSSLAIILIPTTAFVFFFADELVNIWLTEAYSETAVILRILFAAVVFRSLSKLGDSLLRAKDAVFQGAWFKVIYVLLIAGGIWFTVPLGMKYVAAAIVVATFIHYVMNMFICSKLVGIKISDIISALIPATILGVITWVTSWSVSVVAACAQLNNFFSLIAGIGANALILLAAIKFIPGILGNSEVNPLMHLPERFLKNKFMAGILNR